MSNIYLSFKAIKSLKKWLKINIKYVKIV
jgi:hypothetical protein